MIAKTKRKEIMAIFFFRKMVSSTMKSYGRIYSDSVSDEESPNHDGISSHQVA